MVEKKQVEKNNGIGTVAAAVTGAVVGAGIAVAGAVALKDEKNRDKVKAVISNVKNQMDNVQKQAQDTQSDLSGKIAEGEKKIEKAAAAAKESLSSK